MGPKLYASVINHWANDDLVLLDITLKQFETSGCIASITKYKALAADLEYQKGNIHKALQRIDDCLTLCGSMKEYYYHSELVKLHDFYLSEITN